ncbi:family 78 glycoside hydrolase catalytic domain [Prolixibacteraceae bacterium Z1-6]|uniref:alpha-L-rhamnosidase n=1 Tax=Draconibacterium aestuarii TaxID=2998507 RepID=A0A9X3F5I2_9BACT|nr:family 78 glycoside hydrolase catalytic domain [Prolixibacteraceae bacterium Z1-6]
MINPLGIENEYPTLSWEINSEKGNKSQTAYHILVSSNLQNLANENGDIWNSGKILSGNSINVSFDGKSLNSGENYFWKVKIWDESGNESTWSEPSKWEMGMLSKKDWNAAKWIAFENMDASLRLVPGIHGNGNNLGEKAVERPVIPMFRKSFDASKNVISATLSISGLGHYEAYLNGKKIGNSFLAPGWTDYDETVYYNTYDVTPILEKGKNVIGAIVGNGFYNINRERYRKLVIAYGYPKMIAHLKIEFDNGTSEIITTDETWKTSQSPIFYASIFGGEDYDATKEQSGWNKQNFDDSEWKQVLIAEEPTGKLVAEIGYPVKVMEVLPVKKIIPLEDGSFLYDFGQNASGIIELTAEGAKGQTIKLWPSELINPDNTNNQKATGNPYYYTYVLSGNGTEKWTPKFTYYGFRYVQVFGAVPDGFNNAERLPVIKSLNFLYTRNSAPQNGTFVCSNDRLNQIHNLIDWAIKSNFQSVVTDCPHREKLGWLEQTHLMGNGIHFRYDNYHLYKKLIFDMIDAQTSEGLVPDIAPEYVEFLDGFRDSPEWGSASVFLPYLLYKWYGDAEIIKDAWPMIIKYINYLKKMSDDHLLTHGLGDWFDLGPERPGVAQLTPVSLTATAIYFYDVKIMAEMADVIQKQEKEMLLNWAEEIRKRFNSEFFNSETKVYSTGSQTAMSMPYCFEIVEEQFKQKILDNLVDSVVSNNKALTAGDVGFHFLVEALTKGGKSQLIYEMINRDDVPGYGYQLKKGATALTESWEALENVSNNHLMLGHVMEWFYAGLGGIGQSETSVAYKEIVIKPEFVGDLTFAKTGFNSPFGLIRSEWQRTNEGVTLEVEIPNNTSANVILPTNKINTVRLNGVKPPKQNLISTGKGNQIVLKLGSGVYKIHSGLDL